MDLNPDDLDDSAPHMDLNEAIERRLSEERAAKEKGRLLSHNAATWAWTVHWQAGRLHEAADAARLASESTRRTGRNGFETQQVFMQLTAEKHFFVNAADHLRKAVKEVRKTEPTLIDAFPRKVWLYLRNSLEHWDTGHDEAGNPRGARVAHGQLASKQGKPNAKVEDFTFGTGGTWIGGIGSVDEMATWALDAYDRLK